MVQIHQRSLNLSMNTLKDHREIGRKLDLFSFHEYAPGAVFWHPKGLIIYHQIMKLIRSILNKSGYQEIKTPVMVKNQLFIKSGHFKHFGKHNMFNLAIYEDEEIKAKKIKFDEETGTVEVNYSLKPMNCPESTLIYNTHARSYRDLPLKFSDFGVLHRRELSGVIGGLFRLREFTIDDAHIYCRKDQIMDIVSELLNQIKIFYDIFGLPLRFYLSTKPDKALALPDHPSLWEEAENDLKKALESAHIKYGIKEKDGAFYGPKIDFHITDSQERDWQLATVQLDFQMPRPLDVMYTNEKGKKEYAVIVHRAFTGSIERFIGILIEHFQGNLPLWLAPIQVAVLPVSDEFLSFAREVGKQLEGENVRVAVNCESKTLGAKIRDCSLQKIPYMVIIGKREYEKSRSTTKDVQTTWVAVRTGQNLRIGGQKAMKKPFGKEECSLYEFLTHVKQHIENKIL
ncbi:MAG TPA: threonine--tRNA ligase [Patescibacteria group bacterium]|nr:threonine--tRNA ligase [Patescibacteria group bacterium]